MMLLKPLQEKKAYIVSIETLVFRKKKRHIKQTGVAVLEELLNIAEEVIIFISNQVIVLLREVFGTPILTI